MNSITSFMMGVCLGVITLLLIVTSKGDKNGK